MKKPGKYLKFYNSCIEVGHVLDENGLCQNFEDYDSFELFKLFSPTESDKNEYEFADDAYYLEDRNNISMFGSVFGPTRQNVVLLMAAMNNEL